jgi:hypothetical protein
MKTISTILISVSTISNRNGNSIFCSDFTGRNIGIGSGYKFLGAWN